MPHRVLPAIVVSLLTAFGVAACESPSSPYRCVSQHSTDNGAESCTCSTNPPKPGRQLDHFIVVDAYTDQCDVETYADTLCCENSGTSSTSCACESLECRQKDASRCYCGRADEQSAGWQLVDSCAAPTGGHCCVSEYGDCSCTTSTCSATAVEVASCTVQDVACAGGGEVSDCAMETAADGASAASDPSTSDPGPTWGCTFTSTSDLTCTDGSSYGEPEQGCQEVTGEQANAQSACNDYTEGYLDCSDGCCFETRYADVSLQPGGC